MKTWFFIKGFALKMFKNQPHVLKFQNKTELKKSYKVHYYKVLGIHKQ